MPKSSHTQLQRAKPTIDELKRGVALMSTRPFGEKFIERLLSEKYELHLRAKSADCHHDLVDSSGNRVESKFARIYTRCVKGRNLCETIANARHKRLASIGSGFTANFQKIHPEQFRWLWFGLVCDEGIYVYSADRLDININLKQQHINVPNMKQFSMRKAKLKEFAQFFKGKMSWQEVRGLLMKLSEGTSPSSRARKRRR